MYTDDVAVVDDMKKDFERDVAHSDVLDAKFVKRFWILPLACTNGWDEILKIF